MSFPFSAIDAAALSVIDGVMGEPLRFLPRLEGRYSTGSADPGRSAFDAVALVTEDQEVVRTDGEQKNNFGFDMVAGPIRISVARSVFVKSGWVPKKGDRLQAIARDGQPLFEIARVAPDNTNRILFICVRVHS